MIRRSHFGLFIAAPLLWSCGETLAPRPVVTGLRAVSGNAQVRFPNSKLIEDLRIEVIDDDGNRVTDADFAVAWEIAAGGGRVQPDISFTGGGGVATTTWVLGPSPGPQEITATIESIGSLTFTADAVPVGPIVFVSTRDVAFNPETLDNDIAADVFVMEPDGSNPVRITPQEGAVNWLKDPGWTPSGDEVVYVRDLLLNPTNPVTQTLTPNGIHFYHLVTGVDRRAPPTTNNGFFLSMINPAVSPTGGDMATVNGQVWLLSTGGTNTRSATDDANTGPTWSPDGTMIAFSCAPGICTQVPGQNGTRTAITANGNDREPDWALDGTRIAFTRPGANRGIWVTDTAGNAEQQIVFGNYSTPSWSPDGTQLVATLTHPSGLRDVVLIEVSTGIVTNLTNGNGDSWDPAWRR